ncbi:uncharacterized protein LOC126236381 isoform X8 [Schistocerca nitens]|uniref:uncharacterized protein LOC126236381 isoform X8 n=1 Tax=Schistocerca nitens TaxID=7011 RepID=UPI00211843BC|nr:uncharacterized protein LOC126236381 isoform X8 [Schistocerca nitens]
MDDGSREQSSPEPSVRAGPSALGQNEQADQEVQPLWSSYRKPTPCPESDPESDNQSYATEASSDESVQWEKEFIGKLMKVKKYSCQQERTAPASEDVIGKPAEEELPKHCDVNQDTKQSSYQQQESEVPRSILNQDVIGKPAEEELPKHCDVNQDTKQSSYQQQESEVPRSILNQDVIGKPAEEELPKHCDVNQDTKQSSYQQQESEVPRSILNQDVIGKPAEEELPKHCDVNQDTKQSSYQQQESEVPRSILNQQQPGCSNNCCVSSSCDSNQLQLRPDIETEDHICGKLNLGYVSRWMKAQPASPTHCGVSSSYDSESDDGHAGSREQERERQNQTSLQQAQPNSDFILAGTSEESEKMIESPRNCQVSSSCESDSDASGYSKLCLRVSEDSVEDDTDHSSGKDKRKKSCGTSIARKDGDDTHINARPEQYKSVESVNYDVSDEVPTETAPLSPRIKRRNISHLGQLGSYSQLDSNQPSHRRHQWTRDLPCRGRPARLRSQSPADRVSRWKRSPSPEESCRKLRSRSVLPIRDTQRVTWRKRRSKSCDTYRKHKRSHESRHPSKEHLLFKRMEPVSEPSSNSRVGRQSRSTRRRWSKPASISGRHKASTSSRDKSTLQMTASNSESLSVRMAARCIHCSSSHKFQKEHSVLESERAIQGRSHVNQTLSSKTQNVAEEQLTYRTRRSLSRSRSVLNTAQQESGAEVIGTKIMHSLSGVQENSGGREQPPQGFKEHTRNQSMCLNTSKRNKRTSKKKEAPKEHVTTLRSDSVIQNQKSFTQLNKFCELAQEQPAFGSKLSVRINRLKNTEDFRTNQLSGEQSSLEDKYLITDDISARLQHSDPEDAFRKKIHSHRSQVSSEERPTSSNKQSLSVNMSRGQNHLNKFQEIKDQSTFSSTNSLLTKSSEDVHLSKGKELSYDHVADSSCLMPKNNTERHTESKKNQELAGGTLNLKNFKGFPEEKVSVNGKLSLPAIISESCDFPISTQALHQLYSASKRHSASVLTQGTSSSLNEVKMAPDPLSDSRRLSRKRKLSKEDYQSQHKSLKSRCQFLSAPCVACENQGHLSKRRVLGKVKQSAEAVQSILQSNNMKVSKNKALLLQTATYNSHLQLGHSSTVNGSTASSETSQEKSYSKISGRNSSLFKDANAVCDVTASDARAVKCSSQDRICCKEDDALLGPSTSQIKPCSVVLKNLVLSSEKFVFPPFPHVAWTTKVSDFCLPQDYMNTVWKIGK